jgi:hypothetical protein
VREAERGARVAAVGDVGVELAVGGAEALAVLLAAEDRSAVADEQRAGLEEVAARAPRSASRGAMRGYAASTCTQARTASNGAGTARVARHAARAHLAERRAVGPDEEAADDRLLDSATYAPRLELGLARDHRDPQLGPRALVGGDVDRRRPAVAEGQPAAAGGEKSLGIGHGLTGYSAPSESV